jgi:alginate biosynthesis protein AlgX
MRGSISHYLLSGNYREDRPKIIIWELASYYGYNKEDFFREIIPAIHGVCKEENTLSADEKTLAPGKDVFLFDNLQDKNLHGHDYYLSLEFPAGQGRDITLNFQHAGGKEDSLHLQRDIRSFPQAGGLYFAELNDEITTPLEKIILTAGAARGTIRAKLCRVPAVP